MFYTKNPVINLPQKLVLVFLVLIALIAWKPSNVSAQNRYRLFTDVDYLQSRFDERYWTGQIIIKFRDERKISLRQLPIIADSPSEQTLVADIWRKRALTDLKPLFPQPDYQLNQLRQQIETKTGTQLADLNKYATAKIDSASLFGAIRDLAKLDSVEVVYPEMRFIPADVTPNLEYKQAYLNDYDHGGLGIRYAWQFPGGRGKNVTIEDLEVYDFDYDHEDLTIEKDEVNCSGSSPDSTSHGTNTAGVIAALDNGIGVTGIAPQARFVACPGPSSIVGVANSLSLGDIILLEFQSFDYLPIEQYPAEFDAISYATGLGIVLVEPAGNGGHDLDNPEYEGLFDRTIRDSRAIMVGGGQYYTGAYNGQNYGSRIDVQAWSSGVATTASLSGSGSLYDGGEHRQYVSGFSGTSAASAMIAGVASVLQSIYKELNQRPLLPLELRDLLVRTGKPQHFGEQKIIGPSPDLRNALIELGIGSPPKELPRLLPNPSFGLAARFGGESDERSSGYIRIPATGELPQGDWTIEFWLKSNYLVYGGKSLYVIESPDQSEGVSWWFSLTWSDPGLHDAVYFFHSNNFPSYSSVRLVSPKKIPLRKWVHVALVKQGHEVALYLQGKKSQVADHRLSQLPSGPMAMGAFWRQNHIVEGQSLAGDIDEFRISKTARYIQNFRPPLLPFVADDSTLVLYHFDQPEGNQVTDSSGKQNHGEIIQDVKYVESSIPAAGCEANILTDQKVNSLDLLLSLGQQSWECFSHDCQADFDLNGVVDSADLKQMLTNFGSHCQ